MKHINLILSVLFWAIASVSMAVTLPTSSYSSFVMDEEATAYSISTGTTFMNHSLTASASSAYENCAPGDDVGYTTSGVTCWDCCSEATGSADFNNPGVVACMGYCMGTHLGTLDASVAVLLSMVVAYAGFMYYRRRKENAEQA